MIAASSGSASAPSHDHFHRPIVAESPAMRMVLGMLDAAAAFDTTVLLLGESGVGKELAARRLHAKSRRSARPFIPVDCTTLSDNLLESQLFGHVKGAFTGAEREGIGFVRAADGGTLFLDEIGELPLAAQAKLLRVLQERAVTPVGATKPIDINIRVVAATHRDLRAMVKAGKFREDLFYRLHVVRVVVPPLRERPEDVAPIARHLLAGLAALYQGTQKRLSDDALEALQAYTWPGNVRELANAMEHAFVFSPGAEVMDSDLPEHIRGGTNSQEEPAAETSWLRDDQRVVPLHVAERDLIVRALRESNGRQSRAAEMLQIERRRLYRKVKAHGLQALTRG